MLIYILLRLFVPKKNYYLEGDELRYLATSNNFYKLWNRSFYDTHPPAYAFAIRMFKWLGDWQAGILTSLLCSVLLYFVSATLYDVLGLTASQKATALACLTFNYTLIYYSNRIFRYQLIALLGTTTILLLVQHQHMLAGITWGLLGLTCSYVALRGFWIWGLLGCNIITLVAFGMIYGLWIIKKVQIYFDHKYYPSGIDGKIERVDSFTLRQLISPLYFPWNYSYYGKRELGYDLKNWHKKIGGIFGLYQLPNKYLNTVISLVTAAFIFFTIKGALSSPWWVPTLTVVLLYPSLLKRFLPRNSIIAIPLICFMLGKGLPQIPQVWVNFVILGSVFSFFCFNRVFAFTKPKIKARLTSRFIDTLEPFWGIMAEGLISYPIAYRSKKRVVVIPHNPSQLDAVHQFKLTMREFNIRYAVISDLYKTELHLGYPIIKYIMKTKVFNGTEWVPKFKLLKTIREDNDTYYVYDLH